MPAGDTHRLGQKPQAIGLCVRLHLHASLGISVRIDYGLPF